MTKFHTIMQNLYSLLIIEHETAALLHSKR